MSVNCLTKVLKDMMCSFHEVCFGGYIEVSLFSTVIYKRVM